MALTKVVVTFELDVNPPSHGQYIIEREMERVGIYVRGKGEPMFGQWIKIVDLKVVNEV